MFITKYDTFDRIFYCHFDDYRVTIIDSEKWESLTDKKQAKYTKYEVTFSPLSWGAHSGMKAACFYVDPESNMRVFNYDMYNMKKLCMVVKRWNLTRKNADGDVDKVDPTEEMVKKLHPLVAQYMLEQYEGEIELSGEAEKN